MAQFLAKSVQNIFIHIPSHKNKQIWKCYESVLQKIGVCCVVILYSTFYTQGPLMLPWNYWKSLCCSSIRERIPSLKGAHWDPSACADPHFRELCIPQASCARTSEHSCLSAATLLWLPLVTCNLCSGLGAVRGTPDPTETPLASAFSRDCELVSLESFHGLVIVGGWFGQRAPAWSEVAGAGITAELCWALLVTPFSPES